MALLEHTFVLLLNLFTSLTGSESCSVHINKIIVGVVHADLEKPESAGMMAPSFG